ncbi:MAG: hypothetical protein EZS28_047713, partial [Streblomastix strix]
MTWIELGSLRGT